MNSDKKLNKKVVHDINHLLKLDCRSKIIFVSIKKTYSSSILYQSTIQGILFQISTSSCGWFESEEVQKRGNI